MPFKIGRVFRKMGLPAWTFVGIGISAIWFNYIGSLLEKFLKVRFGVTDQTQGFIAYLPQLMVFSLPFMAVGFIWLRQSLRHQTSKILFHDSSHLQKPEGKKGLILLTSNPNSAMFAIEYHLNEKETLECVWLIPSNNSEEDKFGPPSLENAREIERRCEKLGKKLKVRIYDRGVSPADSQDTFDYVNRLFRNSPYSPDELIADFTGGTKPMSVGMIMACLPAERALEYVSLNPISKQSYGPYLIDYQHRAFDLIG